MKRVLLPFALLLVCAAKAWAQQEQCLSNANPCEAYAGADAVFMAKVIRVAQPPLQIWMRDKDYDQVATVAVEKVFKGTARKTMVLHQLGRKGAPKFLERSSYVFYANFDRVTKKWEVRRCGRTRMSKYANDDLRYFEGLPQHLNKTRIAGEVTRHDKDEDNPQGQHMRLAGVKIHIKGEGKDYEVVTDANGVYEVIDAPPGKYTIEPEMPAGLTLLLVIHYGIFDPTQIKSLKLELKEGGCTGADIILTSAPTTKQTIGNF